MNLEGQRMPNRSPTVWILTYLRPEVGSGVERFVSNLSTALRSRGFHISVLDSTAKAEEDSMLMNLRPFVAWRLGRELNRRVAPNDVVVCNGYFSWNARRKKSIVVYHGTELGRARATMNVTSRTRNMAIRILNARLDRLVSRGRLVVAVSEATGEELKCLYGLKVDMIIHNGIDLDEYRPVTDKMQVRAALALPQDKFLILYAGPPDARKGFDFLIHELRPRLRGNQNLVVTTKMRDEISGVIPVGRIRLNEIVRYYQACDAFVMPSLYEGCSFALAEALACGLPSVVSNTGSARDMLADSILSKYVVNQMDSEEYAKRLTALEDSIQERTIVSEASRHFAEKHFNIRDFNRKYIDLVCQIAEDTGFGNSS